jgi:ParB family transcriptional regulator, chromosome partitioning protein
MKVPVDSIVIRERVRRDIGDIDSLARSMREHGQLNPLSLTRNNELIAGHRRLMAARKLGWQYVEASIVERDSETEKLELELEENVHRKDFSPEELLAGFRRLEKLRKPPWSRRVGHFFSNFFGKLFRRKPKAAPEALYDPKNNPFENRGDDLRAVASTQPDFSKIADVPNSDPYGV